MSYRKLTIAIGAVGLVLIMGYSASSAQGADAHPHFTLADEGQRKEPFKVFDNLYFVGIKYVASWLLVTDDGLILIDTLFGDEEYKDYLLDNIRELGFDPADLKYILISQGHPDHYGQAFSLQKLTGATIGTGRGDWELLENDLWASSAPRRDWVIENGDTLTLGDTTMRFEITPGHTAGTVSMEFPVRDGNNSYAAYLAGGTSVRTHDPEVIKGFIADMERIKSYEHIDVQINNHPFIDDLFDRKVLLDNRKDGDIHPFVASEDFRAWIGRRIKVAQDQLDGVMED